MLYDASPSASVVGVGVDGSFFCSPSYPNAPRSISCVMCTRQTVHCEFRCLPTLFCRSPFRLYSRNGSNFNEISCVFMTFILSLSLSLSSMNDSIFPIFMAFNLFLLVARWQFVCILRVHCKCRRFCLRANVAYFFFLHCYLLPPLSKLCQSIDEIFTEPYYLIMGVNEMECRCFFFFFAK